MSMKKVFSLCFSIFFCFQLFAQKNTNPTDQKIDLDPMEIRLDKRQLTVPTDFNSYNYDLIDKISLEKKENSSIKVVAQNQGRPSLIKGVLPDSKASSNLDEQVYVYLQEIGDELQIDVPEEAFSLVDTQEDEIGMKHWKFQQEHLGIPIFGAQLMLHSKGDKILKANGLTVPTPSDQLSLAGVLEEGQIKEIVKGIRPEKPLTPAQSRFIKYRWKFDLVWQIKDPSSNELRLAYHVEYFPNAMENLKFFIDAKTGEVIEQYEGGCKFHAHETPKKVIEVLMDGPATATAQDLFGINRNINTYEVGNTYFLIDANRPMFDLSPNGIFESSGLIATLDAMNTSPESNAFDFVDVTSNNNSWTDPTSVSAHYNGGQSYEYFRQVHGRNSINGLGGSIFSLIHVADPSGSSMGNAFWNGQAIWYGDGDDAFFPLAAALDVAGHELSHGVIQSSANLVYMNESGALNESFADVFGAMIDEKPAYWEIGEDIVKTSFFPSGKLRDMKDPHNGAAPGNFSGGFQPKHVDEQFTGSQDNGGVHINSGIPNHAFYLFAEAVGVDKAEKIWYRALVNYLTSSSNFIDFRIATIEAASDLYGNTEVQALRSAMDQVGILDGTGSNNQQDTGANDGGDFLVMTSNQMQNIYIADLSTGDVEQISDKDPISKPSVTDDGTEIVFIGSDKKMHLIQLEWNGNQIAMVDEIVLQEDPVWRNIVISRDGNRLAGLFDQQDNRIWVYDFALGAPNTYELYNPSTSSGGNVTGNVKFADALEFDFTGNWVMYDALNELNGSGSSSVEYWDIGFLKIWNEDIDTWSLGEISKLFSDLPDNVGVGNPSFSKNSPYIIAFDYFEEFTAAILGYNLETGENGEIREQPGLGFPSYGRLDDAMVYDDFSSGNLDGVGLSDILENKLQGENHSNITDAFRWARWFSNGQRTTNVEDQILDELKFNIVENPVSNDLKLAFDLNKPQTLHVEVLDISGKVLFQDQFDVRKGSSNVAIDLDQSFPSGHYFVRVHSNTLASRARKIQLIR